MGRQNKVDLPYFELDCHMDDKIKLIQAEFGLKGFAVVVKLYQRIYGGEFGYYCEWDEERSLLFALENGLNGDGKNLINNIVSACIKRNIFSNELYKKYGILTSSGVQKQYLKATAKREAVELKKEYLLISVPENRSNVVINSISGGENAVSGVGNTQSNSKSYKDSKENNNKLHDIVETQHQEYNPSEFERKCVVFLIKSILTDFPNQRVPKTENEIKKWAIHINRLQRIDGISTEDIWNTLVWAMNDSFWRTNIRSTGKFREKYQTLYLQSKRNSQKQRNQFNDFEQNKYDFDKLEKELTANL